MGFQEFLREFAAELTLSAAERQGAVQEARLGLNKIKDLSDYDSRNRLEKFVRTVARDEFRTMIIDMGSAGK